MVSKRAQLKKIGILTGGGDCPGLNAVIRAVVKTSINDYGAQAVGFEDGFLGLLSNRYVRLDYTSVSGILSQGGTVLGTSNKASPFDRAVDPSTPVKRTKKINRVFSHIAKHRIDVLFCIGGDGTMSIAEALSRLGVPIVGIPKTIDNDLSGTDFTFGFNSAVQVATEAIDRLHSTAMSHHRVMIVEVMGRYAGWLALYAGVAGGGDIILIPEIPYDLDLVCRRVTERNRRGKRFSIIVVAEGAKPRGGTQHIRRFVKGSPDPVRLGGISRIIANGIERKTGLEVRVTNLGHLQRGGSPTAYDRLLATRFGVEAVRMAVRREFGHMVALRGNDIIACPLAQAVAVLKLVQRSEPLISAAKAVGTSFGS